MYSSYYSDEVIHNGRHAAIERRHTTHKMLEIRYVDLVILFRRATGLPQMDGVFGLFGSADPYIIANVDNKVSFRSTIKSQTRSPEWNEEWRLRNVPSSAALSVEMFDKDQESRDDYIGGCKVAVIPRSSELALPLTVGHSHTERGKLYMKIESAPSEDRHPEVNPYMFDGPIRFSRHSSYAMGRLMHIEGEEVEDYSTWSVILKSVSFFFGNSTQPWDRNYKAAQTIFHSSAIQLGIREMHRSLYAHSMHNTVGVIQYTNDIFQLLHGDNVGGMMNPYAHRVKPTIYTYVIALEDDSLRFSETGASFFVDHASKHALHSDCAPAVRYSGEFHPRPVGGWASFSDHWNDEDVSWELVFDNESGTYRPNPDDLHKLRDLLQYNFPGLQVVTYKHGDAPLKESKDACRAYAKAHRHVHKGEMRPHVIKSFTI